MYLSSLILNPKSRAARRDMHDVYQLHRTLLSAFPGKEDGGVGQVLWRLDNDRRTGTSRVLVQSSQKPNWNALNKQWTDYLADDVPEGSPAMQFKELPTWQFDSGQRLVFRLRANPTVKRDGKRHGLLTDEDQTAWLLRKAASAGFRVSTVSLIPEPSRESTKGRERHLKFVSALFEGKLEVTDPALFVETLAAGIGSAKAFGFGLLSVARA